MLKNIKKNINFISEDYSNHKGSIKRCIRFVKSIEFHIDLDKNGFEYNSGFCWLSNEAGKIINLYKNKKFSQVEINERHWRSDPIDRLRPIKEYR